MAAITFLVGVLLYVLILSGLLKLASRLVLRCSQPFGNAIKVVLINFAILLVVQIGLMIIIMLFVGFEHMNADMLENSATGLLMQLIMFFASVFISAYVYSRWISCPGTDYEEGTSYMQGLGIYLVQVLIVMAVATLIIGAAVLIGGLS